MRIVYIRDDAPCDYKLRTREIGWGLEHKGRRYPFGAIAHCNGQRFLVGLIRHPIRGMSYLLTGHFWFLGRRRMLDRLRRGLP